MGFYNISLDILQDRFEQTLLGLQTVGELAFFRKAAMVAALFVGDVGKFLFNFLTARHFCILLLNGDLRLPSSVFSLRIWLLCFFLAPSLLCKRFSFPHCFLVFN
uniref:Uncharacterized protein n=1 Tax=Magallana gigas TaxID=29159 RepID=K1Q7B1_MAGGI